MISRARAAGEAPSVEAASPIRGSRFVQKVPTMRTTTATLKNACATRIGAQSALEAVREDREERERHDDRGQHERHDDARADDAATPEAVAPEHIRRRGREREREERRRERLPHREPHHLAGEGIREDVERRIASPAQAAIEDGGQRVEEEQREERERHADRDGAPRHAGSSHHGVRPRVHPAARGSDRSLRAEARADARARPRSARTPAAGRHPSAPGTRTSAAGCPPGSASRA